MIRVEKITKSFGDLQVLKGIDLEVPKGKLYSIVGPSGAGKTTLLQIIGTLSQPSAGNVFVNGQNISVISKYNLTPGEKKLSTELLLLTGSIDFPPGINRDALEQQMKQDHQIMWIDSMGSKTENKTDYPVVYVYIKTREKIDAGLLASYAWNITNTDPANHIVVAWVNVTNLVTLASLDSVQSVQMVIPPLIPGGSI